MKTIPTTTLNGSWIHYAVEANSPDGEFVICKTHSLAVALAVLATRVWPDEEENRYIHASVIPYDAKQEDAVWLGFPFHHKGAKEAVAQMGHYDEDRQEAVLSEDGHQAIFDAINKEEGRLMGY
jgi:hypothetical protein